MKLTIRTRLTAWHLAVFGVGLLLWSVSAYQVLEHSLRARTDASLAGGARVLSELLDEEAREEPAWTRAQVVAEALREFGGRGWAAGIYAPDGAVVARLPGEAAGEGPVLPGLLGGGAGFREITSHGEHPMRALVVGHSIRGVGYRVLVARSLREEHEILEELGRAFALSAPLVLLFAGAGGWALTRRALAPVEAMGRKAALIGTGNLNARLPEGNPGDELGRMAAVFNAMLARLDGAFERQRRFMADASHELRTPVAVVRGEAEVALARPDRPPEELREALAVVAEEGRSLTRIVEDLFTLARADAGQHPLQVQDLYLDELLHDAAHTVRTLAAARRVAIADAEFPEVPYQGDEGLLRRMIVNLIDNAVKHTVPGGAVTLSLASGASGFRLAVTDQGEGVPAGHEARIFERFHRADVSRARAAGREGGGLGLPIARWIAEAHGGRLELERTGPDGSTFAVTLPRAPVLASPRV